MLKVKAQQSKSMVEDTVNNPATSDYEGWCEAVSFFCRQHPNLLCAIDLAAVCRDPELVETELSKIFLLSDQLLRLWNMALDYGDNSHE